MQYTPLTSRGLSFSKHHVCSGGAGSRDSERSPQCGALCRWLLLLYLFNNSGVTTNNCINMRSVSSASQAACSRPDCMPPTHLHLPPRSEAQLFIPPRVKPSFISLLCSSRGRSGLHGVGSRCWKVVMLGWFKLESFWAHSSKLMPPSKLGQICYGHLQCPPMLFNGCLALQPHSSAPGRELSHLVFFF